MQYSLQHVFVFISMSAADYRLQPIGTRVSCDIDMRVELGKCWEVVYQLLYLGKCV